jgi:hypothetical protein
VGQVRVEWPWRSGAKRCKGRSFESRMLGEVHGISFRGRRLILRTSSSGLRRIGDEYVPVHRARTAADNRSQRFWPSRISIRKGKVLRAGNGQRTPFPGRFPFSALRPDAMCARALHRVLNHEDGTGLASTSARNASRSSGRSICCSSRLLRSRVGFRFNST